MRGVRTNSLIEEWTQTKAWWKRRWGWKNVRHKYKTENMFVLAISNHWFEMSGPSKARNKKPSLQVLLHQNATMNFSPFVGRQATLLPWQWSRPIKGDAIKIGLFRAFCLGLWLLVRRRLDWTTKTAYSFFYFALSLMFQTCTVASLGCFLSGELLWQRGFRQKVFFGRFFGGDWHVLQNVLNPGEPCALWTFKFRYVTCGSKRSHAGQRSIDAIKPV